MNEWKQCMRDAIEQLKAQREHVGDAPRVLEAIICHCADVARARYGADPVILDLATQCKNSAIELYAASKPNLAAVIEFLEEVITRFEQRIEMSNTT